jgi:CRP/FNR family transcriptional regulator
MKKILSPSCETCQSRIDSVFCKLSDDQISELSISKQCGYYSKGQIIFTEGNHSNNLFCVNNGKVKLSKFGGDGKEQIIRLAKDGDILGYRSVISGELYSVTATAIEDSKICSLPKSTFFELLEENTDLTSRIMKLLTDDLKSAQTKITTLAQKPVLERLAETLLMLDEFYEHESSSDVLYISITREEIANIVGTSTENAIRILADLRKEKIIDLDGKKITILKKDSLLKLANIFD